jgi:hypothetical protein
MSYCIDLNVLRHLRRMLEAAVLPRHVLSQSMYCLRVFFVQVTRAKLTTRLWGRAVARLGCYFKFYVTILQMTDELRALNARKSSFSLGNLVAATMSVCVL